MKSKSKAQKCHAIRRYKERFGDILTQKEYDELCRHIQSGKGKILGKQSNRIRVIRIIVKNNDTLLLWDNHRKRIITFFTTDMELCYEPIEIKEEME